MYTSAQAVCEIFSSLTQHKQPSDRFLDVLADHLGIEGEERDLLAATALKRLIGKVRADFDSLDVDENYKKNHASAVRSLDGLWTLSQIYYTMQQAKDHFLKPANIVALMNLHTAFDGKVGRYDLKDDLDDLSQIVAETREKLKESSIQPEVANLIDARLSQIDAVFRNYRFFGPDGLDEMLVKLCGEIAIRTDANSRDVEPGLYEKLGKIVGGSLKALKKVDAASKTSERIVDRIPKLSDAFGDLVKFLS